MDMIKMKGMVFAGAEVASWAPLASDREAAL